MNVFIHAYTLKKKPRKMLVYWQNSSIGCDQIVGRRVPNFVPVYKYDTTSINIPGIYYFVCGRISYNKGLTAGFFQVLVK